MKESPFDVVLKHYPKAKALNIGTKKGGNYFHIMSEGYYLGKGKSKSAAWKAAYRNL